MTKLARRMPSPGTINKIFLRKSLLKQVFGTLTKPIHTETIPILESICMSLGAKQDENGSENEKTRSPSKLYSCKCFYLHRQYLHALFVWLFSNTRREKGFPRPIFFLFDSFITVPRLGTGGDFSRACCRVDFVLPQAIFPLSGELR